MGYALSEEIMPAFSQLQMNGYSESSFMRAKLHLIYSMGYY